MVFSYFKIISLSFKQKEQTQEVLQINNTSNNILEKGLFYTM